MAWLHLMMAVPVWLVLTGTTDAHAPAAGRIPSVVARALPAVVSITTRHIERDQFNRGVATRGLGSGIIVDGRGFIVTNNHVVAEAEQIKVTLNDERTFRATLVGADRFTDLAVLKIDARNLPTTLWEILRA